jgi:hypothetical protein
VNADLSVAPEIAQLASPFVPPGGNGGTGKSPVPGGSPGGTGGVEPPRGAEEPSPRTNTVGRCAAELAELAAAPQRWWDLVRFDPDGPLRIPVPGAAGAWLLVLPPGAVADCDCRYATLLAGQAAESGRPLRSGRVRVHGDRSRHRTHGERHGYSVSLHRGDGHPPGGVDRIIIANDAERRPGRPELERLD